jgi:hypothetical protein
LIDVWNTFTAVIEGAPDWNAISAIATAAAVGVALLLPIWQRHAGDQIRKKGLAHPLIFKMMRITADSHQFFDHVQKQRARAEKSGSKFPQWEHFRAVLGGYRQVTFTTDELAMLLSLRMTTRSMRL